MEAVNQVINSLEYASVNIKEDRDFILSLIKNHRNGSYVLYHVSNEFNNDHEIVLETVKQNGLMLKYAGENIKKDREIVLTAIKENVKASEFIDKDLLDDYEIVLEIVKRNGLLLKHAGENMQENLNIVLEATKQNMLAIQYAGVNVIKEDEIKTFLLNTYTLLKRTCFNCKKEIYIYFKKEENEKIICLGGILINENFYKGKQEIEDECHTWLCKKCFDENAVPLRLSICPCGYGINQNCTEPRCNRYANLCIACNDGYGEFCGDCL
jgi:hypothetical protein